MQRSSRDVKNCAKCFSTIEPTDLFNSVVPLIFSKRNTTIYFHNSCQEPVNTFEETEEEVFKFLGL